MKLPSLALGVLALLAFAAPASAKQLWEYAWVEVRTPHFVIASAEGEAKAVRLALDLENFRGAAERLTNVGRFEERIPTKVYALPRLARDLGVDGTVVGLLMPAMRANYALTSPQGAESDEVLKHEYVHFLVRNRDGLHYPTWIDEGYAELLATLRVSENGAGIEFGNVMRWRAESLVNGAWISWETLLGARDTSSLGRTRGAMFYAQSWLLMHYLVIGRPGRDFAADTTKFLAATERGTPREQAFAAAYGLEVKAIGRTLRAYLGRAKYFKRTLARPLPQHEAKVRAMRSDEIAAELGLLALQRGNLEAAERYYGAALAANPDNALALVGSGDLHKTRKEWDAAVAKYERAIALEPTVANHELDYGEYFLSRAADEQDASARSAFLVEARRHFARRYRLDPDNPETLDQNGLTYLLEGGNPAKAAESLELAHQLLPSHPQIRTDLAAAYLEADQPERARPHLYRLLAWGHSSSAERVRELIARLPALPAGAESQAIAAESAAPAAE